MKTLRLRLVVQTLAIVLLAALAVGCATSKIDWAGRVGTYTFDQAVLDLGPPDKQAKLTDGTVVAEWLTRRLPPLPSPATSPTTDRLSRPTWTATPPTISSA